MTELDETALLAHYGLSDPALCELGLFMCESPSLLLAAAQGGVEAESMLVTWEFLKENPDCATDFEMMWPRRPVLKVEGAYFQTLMGFPLTRGPLALLARPKPKALEEILEASRRIVIVEDSTNGANIASIFRSAHTFGIDAILISHSCIDPLQRRAARMSKGTALKVPWLRVGSRWRWASEVLPRLKSFGYDIYGLALTASSVPLDSLELDKSQKAAFILGTEGEGLCKDTLQQCDKTVIIPMREGVDSLNVSAASAIACWFLSKH